VNTAISVAIDAVAYGMILFVICIGLSVTMSLMRVINLAHGAFAMLGGYFASILIISYEINFFASIALAIGATVLVAMPLEWILYRRLYARSDPLMQVVMTVGIVFLIIGIINFLFGPTVKSIPLPHVISGPVDIGVRTIPAHRLFVIGSGLAIFGALWFLLEHTAYGVRLRAAVENSAMAAALGVRTKRMYATAFALSVALGAFGGIAGAELLPMEPYYALRYIVTFLVVVSVGGAGSIRGALLASLLLGSVDTVARYLVPDFGASFFYLAVIAIVLCFPNGLLGREHM
jgi:branched-chain amino acid transport system permease protein